MYNKCERYFFHSYKSNTTFLLWGTQTTRQFLRVKESLLQHGLQLLGVHVLRVQLQRLRGQGVGVLEVAHAVRHQR